MGISNWLMQKMMKKEAIKLADWASTVYPVIKTQSPDAFNEEIYLQMLCSEIGVDCKKEPKWIERLSPYCISINGICYFLAMNLGFLKNTMTFRYIQFTDYMDAELCIRVFTPQTSAIKRNNYSKN